MTEQDMQYVEDAFVAAIERCEKIGCKTLPFFIYINGRANTCVQTIL